MIKWLLAIVILIISVPALSVPTSSFFVSPDGVNNPVCSIEMPCATLQHVADDICPQVCNIRMADGVYHQTLSVTYYKLVSINGNCGNSFAVQIDDGGIGGAIFAGQDHAILTLQCVTLTSTTSGGVGFLTRQFAIGDVNFVNFIQFPGGYGVAANEMSKINVLSPNFYGATHIAMAASDSSILNVGGGITNNGNNSIAFVGAYFNSRIKFYASVAGNGNTYSYICSDAFIENSAAIPGLGAYPGNSGCKTYG